MSAQPALACPSCGEGVHALGDGSFFCKQCALPVYEPRPLGSNGSAPDIVLEGDSAVDGGVAPVDAQDVHETDLGNAARLVRRHGDDLLYSFPQSRWYVWDGRRWARDAVGEVYRRAKETVRAVLAEAAAIPDNERSKQLARHALRSQAEARIMAMISLARSEPGVPVLPQQLDADPWLFNCQNGTIDLHARSLRPHDRADLATMLAPVTYDLNATCPRWLAFLDRIMKGNAGLIGFLQRAIGYSLTGDVSEQVLFFQHGAGANGKSTLAETMLALLGDYGKQAAPGLLTVKRGERHPTELADLAGARFVASVEVDEGRRLAEARVKWLTGGDRVKARHMREDFFEFQPVHKLWLSANHRPTVMGTDHAVWRRLRLIPFNVTIPDGEQDRHLPDKLKAELSGILNWALAGCIEWQKRGLEPPTEVVTATDAYRVEQDILGAFIDDCCTTDSEQKITAKALYMLYTKWCGENGEHAMPQRRFGNRLAERGFSVHRGAKGERWWKGVGGVTQIPLSLIQGDADSGNVV